MGTVHDDIIEAQAKKEVKHNSYTIDASPAKKNASREKWQNLEPEPPSTLYCGDGSGDQEKTLVIGFFGAGLNRSKARTVLANCTTGP